MKKLISSVFAAIIAVVLSGGVLAQSFGGAIAIDGEEVLIGATGTQTTSGTVYVYNRNDSGEWEESERLQASDNDGNDDRFGRAIALSDGQLIIGATKKDNDDGAGYIFERNQSGSWVESAKLSPSDSMESANLGRAVAISDDFAFISAAGYNGGRGGVFIYQRSENGEWLQHSKLTLADADPSTLFGLAIDMQGYHALIGAQIMNENTGGVFAYEYNPSSDTWEDRGEVEIDGMQDGAQLGAVVTIEGDRALVSAPGLGTGSVMVLSFNSENGFWNHDSTLNPIDGDPGSFGSSLAFVGDDIWVGAELADQRTGTIYRYKVGESGSIDSADKFTPVEMEPGARFAAAFMTTDDFLVVGALGVDGGLGAAMVYEKENEGWEQTARFETEVITMDAVTGGEVRCDSGEASGFSCDQIDLLSFLPTTDIGGGRGVRVNDTWGWTDSRTDREYAIVGRVDGTSFIDITDPMNPAYLGNLPKTAGTPSADWRDMKVYRDHVYIVADGAGNHGVQIFDLTQLRDVRDAPVEFEETAHYDGIASAHNIVINESTGFAYTVGGNSGGETCGGGSHILDLSTPTEPTFAGCFGHEGTGRAGTGYSHDSQCVTYHGPDTEHTGKEICFGSNETAISIADVSDKENPVALAVAEYPNVAYAHQGWITDDHKYFYSNDELDELGGNAPLTRTLIWDVSDLDDPVLVKEHKGTTAASDHNLYIKGSFMYQSNYKAGLRILDISNPEEPVEVAYFDTQPSGENTAGTEGSWSNYPYFESGTLIVTSRTEGVFFLKKREIDI